MLILPAHTDEANIESVSPHFGKPVSHTCGSAVSTRFRCLAIVGVTLDLIDSFFRMTM